MDLHTVTANGLHRQVNSRSRVPVIAVALVNIIPCLLTLIYIGSSVAYNDVISMSVSGLFASYLLPCSFLLWRRITGQILPYNPSDEDPFEQAAASPNSTMSMEDPQGDFMHDAILEWGPWRVPGYLGIANNAFACLYCVFVLFWDFWPPATPVTPSTMNYSVLVTGAVIIFAIVYYFAGGKNTYHGPLVDYEVKGAVRRRTSVQKPGN